ncbi:MAG: hypothetical protein IJD13_09960 [Oscillospiraceae bacterium]|nr:hypothetical protein [Oscillospiraceae bacterium]
MKKKKLLIALTAAVVLIAAVILAPYIYAATLPRRTYTDDDRALHGPVFGGMGDRTPPSIELCVKRAGFICEATVLTDGKEKKADGLNHVRFKMLVNDVWFGECRNRILDIGISGHPSGDIKLAKGDRIIIFAARAANVKEVKERYGYEYAVSDGAHGIYIVNPDGRLFSLTDRSNFADFEGQPPAVLKEHIREIRRELKKEK